MTFPVKLCDIYEVYGERNRLLSMEGLRGAAALLIFFVHYQALFGSYAGVHSYLADISGFMGNIGNIGVDLFFVLSGYLIYSVLIRKPLSYRSFVQRRIERIYPTFFAVFCVYLVLSAIFRSENKIHGSLVHSSIYVIENALLLPGIFPITPIITVAWSLSYEMFFYLSIPIIVWITHMKTWNRTSRIVFFVALWLVYIFYAFTVPQSQVRLLMFVAGIVLWESIDSTWIRAKLTGAGEVFVISAFLGSLIFVYIYDARPEWLALLPGISAGKTVLPGVATFQGPYKVIALSLSCFFLALYSFEFDGILKASLSWKPLRYLGNMSYSYYLIHGLTLHTVALIAYSLVPSGTPSAAIFLVSLPIGFAATWIASTFLFILVEKPVSLRGRTTGGLSTRQADMAPASLAPAGR